MMRGKRKGRGGRRGPQVTGELPSDSPKRKDSKLEFQGRLSHACPPITDFFQPQSKDPDPTNSSKLPVKSDASEEVNSNHQEPSDIEDQEDILVPIAVDCKAEKLESSADVAIKTDHGEVEKDDVDGAQSPATPHKILMQESSLLSPSSALSQLSIVNGALKKTSKSRRKLNPSQTANQLAPTAATKLNCFPKSKPSSVGDTKSAAEAAPLNGSQSKLTSYFPVRRSVRKTKKTVLEERQRTLEEAVLLGKEDGLQIHHFEGKGRGIVAIQPFNKGEFVVEYAGELIKMDEAREREKLYAQDQNTGCYMYYFKYGNQQFCVDATPESTRLGRLVNHSRNGNLLTKTITIDNTPRLVLIAKEDIQTGEEVTYDYGDRSKESLKYHPWLAS